MKCARAHANMDRYSMMSFCDGVFLEGLYTPFQLIMDMALLLIGLVVGICIIAYYFIAIFGLPGDWRK